MNARTANSVIAILKPVLAQGEEHRADRPARTGARCGQCRHKHIPTPAVQTKRNHQEQGALVLTFREGQKGHRRGRQRAGEACGEGRRRGAHGWPRGGSCVDFMPSCLSPHSAGSL